MNKFYVTESNKVKIYIWGTGIKSQNVLSAIDPSHCEILGFIDNDPQKINRLHDGFPVIGFGSVGGEWDYIVISVIKYKAILFQLREAGVGEDKVIIYFCENDLYKSLPIDFIDLKQRKIDILEEKNKRLEHRFEIWKNNALYEYGEKTAQMKLLFPVFKSNEDVICSIKQGCSIVRFGDGEFGIISGTSAPVFQKYNKELALRLKEVLQSRYKNLLIGIAPNYGDLSIYPDEVADGIREYMTDEVRKLHYSLLDMKREYCDAYMFKCFIPHKDRDNTPKRIRKIQQIWHKRNVVLIEGKETRSGVGNDLFFNVESLKRILCPTTDAYRVYEELFSKCIEIITKDNLVLIALGPAGKVLAYDLFLKGYQIVDIGQIDMDYEWYLSGTGIKIHNPYKYVSQLPPASIMDIDDEEYKNQIIEVVG